MKGKSPKIKYPSRYYTKSQIQLLLYLTVKYDIVGKDNVGKPMPQKFIDEAFDEMKTLTKLITSGMSPSDLYVENAKKKAGSK